nr:Chain A, DRP8II [synthetic construct]7WEI_A Chain A, drp8I [synthetic construct]
GCPPCPREHELVAVPCEGLNNCWFVEACPPC